MKTRTKFILFFIAAVIIVIAVYIYPLMIPEPGPEYERPDRTNPPSGLTYEEQLKMRPPPPRNLSGTLTSDSIELRWDAPEKVKVPHKYSDDITHYNIYRGITEENLSYYTSTSDLFFKDFNISGSEKYIYEITAVYGGVSEGVPSIEVIVQK